MTKVFLSLNFMYCMERFATQVYSSQRPSFRRTPAFEQLGEAAENESTHVEKLRTRIHQLNGRVYPLGFLFQGAGYALGLITRLFGRRNLFRADVFVETRAVRDYGRFVRSGAFDADTVGLLKGIIADEERHVSNWRKAVESQNLKAASGSREETSGQAYGI